MKWSNGDENHNWVIVQDNGEPLRWSDNGELVIYGGAEDYQLHLTEGDTAMTLAEYAELLGVNWRTLI